MMLDLQFKLIAQAMFLYQELSLTVASPQQCSFRGSTLMVIVQYTAMMHQKMVQQDKNNSDALTQNIHQCENDGSFIKKLVPFEN